MRATLQIVGLMWLAGCGSAGSADPVDRYVGKWTLLEGTRKTDCGAGLLYTSIEDHQVRFVRGTTSDLLLQLFSGALAAPPPTCEIPFAVGTTDAALAAEQTCGSGVDATTWHSSQTRWSINGNGNISFITELTNGAGCSIEDLPVYFLVR